MRYKVLLVAMWLAMSIAVGIGVSASKLYPERNKYRDMVDASVLIFYDNGGFGSGVFIKDNVIVTAAHCLIGRDNINIELSDGTILRSSDLYVDNKEDVGFIFVEADEPSIARVTVYPGDIGDDVYLVGTPYYTDFKFTITKGILSHLDRDGGNWEDLIQTDAEGAPGSSGGPLYDTNGNVIGICVSGPNPGGGITLCESGKSILEAYERSKEYYCE